MALFLDDPPVYDEIIDNKVYMSGVWIAWITSLLQTLSEYLSQYGMFVPNLTTEQRNEIQLPQLGQFIYNTDTNILQVWQIKLGVALWRDITTTP